MIHTFVRSLLRGLPFIALLAPTLSLAATTLEERVTALEARLAQLTSENQTLRALSGQPTASQVSIGGKETKLILGGFAHIHAESGNAPDSRYTGINDRVSLRRARLNLRGNFGTDWSFKFEGDFGANTIASSSGLRAQLTDGYLDWTPNDAVQLRIGQFKTPFGWEQLMADTKNPFVERSLPNDRLTVGRQVGVGLSGDLSGERFNYAIGVFNGNGVNTSANDNDQFLVAARLGAQIWKGRAHGRDATWHLGANGFTTKDNHSYKGTREGFGIDSQLVLGGATLSAEWLRNAYDPLAGLSYAADGWNIAALYDVSKTWQLAARYETYDANTATGGNETDTVVLGFNHFIKGHDIKLTLDYLLGDADLGGGDDRLIGRLQVMF